MRYQAISESVHHPGGVRAGYEYDDWPEYEDGHVYYQVVCLAPADKHTYVAWELPANISEAWVAVVRYTDGDTFGQSHGYGQLEGVYLTMEEAGARASDLRNGADSVEGDPCWEGHFARLERIEVYPVPVKQA